MHGCPAIFFLFVGMAGSAYAQADPFEPNDSTELAVPVVAPAVVEAAIHPVGDTDYYSIELEEGERIIVDQDAVELGSELVATEMRLFDPAGALVAASLGGDNGPGEFLVVADDNDSEDAYLWYFPVADGAIRSGTFLLEVRGGSGHVGDFSGTYRLAVTTDRGEIEPNDDPGEATPIHLPAETNAVDIPPFVQARIEPAGDVDYYAISVPPNSFVSIDIDQPVWGGHEGYRNPSLDSLLRLYRPDGSLVGSNDDGSAPWWPIEYPEVPSDDRDGGQPWDAYLGYHTIPGGDFLIAVDGAGTSTGPYAMSLNIFDVATVQAPYEAVVGLSPSGDVDLHAVELAAGERLDVAVVFLEGGPWFAPHVWFLDGQGEQVTAEPGDWPYATEGATANASYVSPVAQTVFVATSDIVAIPGSHELRIDVAEASALLACQGDCSGDFVVSVDEIVRVVSIALGSAAADECAAGDRDGSDSVTVDEIVETVSRALMGCASGGAAATSR